MHALNLEIATMAIRAIDTPDRADIEIDFTNRYQHAIATSGKGYAEALARSEAEYWLVRVNLDPDGAAYLRSHLT